MSSVFFYLNLVLSHISCLSIWLLFSVVFIHFAILPLVLIICNIELLQDLSHVGLYKSPVEDPLHESVMLNCPETTIIICILCMWYLHVYYIAIYSVLYWRGLLQTFAIMQSETHILYNM